MSRLSPRAEIRMMAIVANCELECGFNRIQWKDRPATAHLANMVAVALANATILRLVQEEDHACKRPSVDFYSSGPTYWPDAFEATTPPLLVEIDYSALEERVLAAQQEHARQTQKRFERAVANGEPECDGCLHLECWSEAHPYGNGHACETLCECTAPGWESCPAMERIQQEEDDD